MGKLLLFLWSDQNTAGDKICIFGFSHGAYTMRALTEFLGIWDTVASIGIISRHLPFTTSNTAIKTFRHAVSLDEHRATFRVNLWHRSTAKERELGTQTDVGGGAVENSSQHNLAHIPLRWMIRQCFLVNTGICFHAPLLAAIGIEPETLYPAMKTHPPAVLHSHGPPQAHPIHAPTTSRPVQMTPAQDSSTEHPINGAQNASDATVSRAVRLGYGNVLLSSILSKEEEHLADALCPMYDQLRLAPLWWLLEVLPMGLHTQRDDNDEWVRSLSVNLGQGRKIPRQERGLNVHRSVQIRMKAWDAVAGGAWLKRSTSLTLGPGRSGPDVGCCFPPQFGVVSNTPTSQG
ncbi:hypothetical protein JB92DRAFT_2826294 [Gautieria morchelliformis]|nr:hypothetical protein JB92DRAFT_2826294 [Gautieria morchelliformis]